MNLKKIVYLITVLFYAQNYTVIASQESGLEAQEAYYGRIEAFVANYINMGDLEELARQETEGTEENWKDFAFKKYCDLIVNGVSQVEGIFTDKDPYFADYFAKRSHLVINNYLEIRPLTAINEIEKKMYDYVPFLEPATAMNVIDPKDYAPKKSPTIRNYEQHQVFMIGGRFYKQNTSCKLNGKYMLTSVIFDNKRSFILALDHRYNTFMFRGDYDKHIDTHRLFNGKPFFVCSLTPKYNDIGKLPPADIEYNTAFEKNYPQFIRWLKHTNVKPAENS